MRDEDFLSELDKKEHPLRMIYPFCLKIYRLAEKLGVAEIFGNSDTIERLSMDAKPEQAKKAHACRILSDILLILTLTLVLTIVLIGKESQTHFLSEGKLERARTGEGTTEYELTVTNDGTDETRNVTVHVSEQRCTGEELDRMFEDAFERLVALVLGDGVSSECITGNLNLVDSIPGTSITVSWPYLDYNYIFSDGTVRHGEIDEPVIASLVSRLEYFDDTRIYSFPIRIMPVDETAEQSFEEKLTALLENEDRESGESRWFTLPTKMDGSILNWSEHGSSAIRPVLFLGLLAAFAIIPGAKEELHKKDKARTVQMIGDYPELISKFELLIGAGMTCRGAFEKICLDYRQSLQAGGQRRYAYEEMLKSQRELNLGMPEARVYEEFGRHSGVPAYQRLGTILANNLRRGSSDIICVLERESQEAFEERKSEVRMRVEEAGTKLLFPMLGMLCIVIAIVVVPAFVSFTG